MHSYIKNKLPQAFKHYATPLCDIRDYNTRYASKNYLFYHYQLITVNFLLNQKELQFGIISQMK